MGAGTLRSWNGLVRLLVMQTMESHMCEDV
jgi:hypothetical protein